MLAESRSAIHGFHAPTACDVRYTRRDHRKGCSVAPGSNLVAKAAGSLSSDGKRRGKSGTFAVTAGSSRAPRNA